MSNSIFANMDLALRATSESAILRGPIVHPYRLDFFTRGGLTGMPIPVLVGQNTLVNC